MVISIYQVNLDRDVNRQAFESYSGKVDLSIYDEVYVGHVDTEDLEEIYYIFNLRKPEGYKGRSMSVSDIVELSCEQDYEWANAAFENKPPIRWWFCDSIGFKEIDFDDAEDLELLTKMDDKFMFGKE